MNSQISKQAYPWSVAIISSREILDVLTSTIQATLEATATSGIIDVVINGNPQLVTHLIARITASGVFKHYLTPLRIWSILIGDKPHAWNQYLNHVWPETKTAFFIDGYVRVKKNALELIHTGLMNHSNYFAATGVPTVGRTATKVRTEMLTIGGLHGNLCAFPCHVMQKMRDSNFHVPLGLYRIDSMLGAVACFGLDPANQQWDPKRILVHPDATWDLDEKKWWKWTHVRAQLNRVLRQAQGDLENKAVRHHLAKMKRPVSSLPITATELIQQWMESCPEEAEAQFRNPLKRRALRLLTQHPRDWSLRHQPPQLVFSLNPSVSP
jgi:hypothetical protein